MVTLRPGQRILNIPSYGVQTSRRAVGGGNGLLNNLIAYWPLNEAGGANNALDLHTNALTLTQTASPGSAAGKVYAGARTLNGSSQYFSRASEALLQTGDVDFTIAAWTKIANKTNVQQAIFGRWRTDDNQREYELSWLKSTDRFIWQNSSNGTANTLLSADSFGSPSLDVWYLIVASHDATNNLMTISVNNGTVNSVEYSAGVFVGSSPTGLGAYFVSGITPNLSVFFQGTIGPVAMWKSAAGGGGVLTSAQRLALWNGGAGLPYASFTV